MNKPEKLATKGTQDEDKQKSTTLSEQFQNPIEKQKNTTLSEQFQQKTNIRFPRKNGVRLVFTSSYM